MARPRLLASPQPAGLPAGCCRRLAHLACAGVPDQLRPGRPRGPHGGPTGRPSCLFQQRCGRLAQLWPVSLRPSRLHIRGAVSISNPNRLLPQSAVKPKLAGGAAA
jgi:hypothetical protein